VLVEEVQSGRRSELRGARAARLVGEIEASLLTERSAGADVTPPARPRDRR